MEKKGEGARYGLVFSLIVLTLLVSTAGTTPLGAIAAVIAQAVTLAAILRATRAGTRAVRISLIAIIGSVLAVIAAIVAPGLPDELVAGFAYSVRLVMVVLGPVLIVRHLVKLGHVTMSTVYGALCIYLLVGLAFATLYPIISLVESQPFFAQEVAARSTDYVYYSFVSLTTVGYGDLTAATDLGRMLSIVEALIGQLYLVTVVALLVANLEPSASGFTRSKDSAD